MIFNVCKKNLSIRSCQKTLSSSVKFLDKSLDSAPAAATAKCEPWNDEVHMVSNHKFKTFKTITLKSCKTAYIKKLTLNGRVNVWTSNTLFLGTDLLSCTEFLLHADKRTRTLLQDPKVSLKAKCEILTSSLDKQCDEIKGLEKEKNEAKKQVCTFTAKNFCHFNF